MHYFNLYDITSLDEWILSMLLIKRFKSSLFTSRIENSIETRANVYKLPARRRVGVFIYGSECRRHETIYENRGRLLDIPGKVCPSHPQTKERGGLGIKSTGFRLK